MQPRNIMRKRSGEAGMTLIEATIALAILFVATAGLTGLGAMAMITTENQGHLTARVAEYAQDKMEQLTSIKYGDTTTDTVTVTSTINCVYFLNNSNCDTGGAGLTAGGTSDADCGSAGHPACVNNYIDYLDVDGNPKGGGLTPPNDWFYKRVWRINAPAGTSGLLQITVSCTTRSTVAENGRNKQPHATLIMFKTFPY